MQVLVRDNNVDQALKALKKKMQREGIFREMKLRRHYEKPSERRAREAAEVMLRPQAGAQADRARRLLGFSWVRPPTLPALRERGLQHGRPAEDLMPDQQQAAGELAQGTVLARRDGRVGRIVLNRPQALNALDLPMTRR